jgi:predicted phosphoribosyltransferase
MAMLRDRRVAGHVLGERLLHHGEGSADLAGKTVVLVDDGVETGATLYAAAPEPKVALA